MRLGGRAQAAIEVLADLDARPRPVGIALRDWGAAHRFAGSGDRSAIGNIVYDAFRSRSSFAGQMGSDDPRSLVLATLVVGWSFDIERLNEDWRDDRHAPDVVTAEEAQKLAAEPPMPDWDVANLPEWLWPMFEDSFEEEALSEAHAFTQRPPVDLRVNALKSARPKVLKALKGSEPGLISPLSIRFPPGTRFSRTPNVQNDAAYQKGWVEVQDEGSQIIAALVDAKPGETILDFCAGAGGKTLAMAADMENRGQIHAFDTDKARLAPIYDRLKRAGTRNVQVHAPPIESLKTLEGRCDRVLVDAPCSGSGTWRRRPDIKWRLTPEQLDARIEEQARVLDDAKAFVRPGGYLCYVTCSVLPAENENQIERFLEENQDFALLSLGEVWEERFGADKPKPWSADGCTVTLTPASTQTDGFFMAVMEKAAG
ncbi:MAG: RsmB/NOP family class I SAM-dependent RNA methyltransferase [Pseudomonadota bacterium]